VAQLGDRHYYFSAVFDQVVDEYTNNPRILNLYEMTVEEFQEEGNAHRRFEDLVGNTRHCCHLPPEQRMDLRAPQRTGCASMRMSRHARGQTTRPAP
jgi:hypothetical protein